MKRITSYLIPILLIVLFLAVVAFRLRSNKQIAEKRVYHSTESTSSFRESDTLVRTELTPREKNLAFSGTFQPNRATKISAETPGKINRMRVDAGSIVREGQALVELDQALLLLQIEAIDVQIEGLEADVERYSILAEADAVQGIKLEKAQLGLKSAQVQRATLEEKIDQTTVRAPFSGVVTAKLNETGGFAAPGVPLLQLIDLTPIKFTIQVPERDLRHFQAGQVYPITADAYPGRTLQGKVSMIGSQANAGQSFPIQFTVENTDQQTLKAGMFGEVVVPIQN